MKQKKYMISSPNKKYEKKLSLCFLYFQGSVVKNTLGGCLDVT